MALGEPLRDLTTLATVIAVFLVGLAWSAAGLGRSVAEATHGELLWLLALGLRPRKCAGILLSHLQSPGRLELRPGEAELVVAALGAALSGSNKRELRPLACALVEAYPDDPASETGGIHRAAEEYLRRTSEKRSRTVA